MPDQLPWRIMMIDDEPDVCSSAKEYIEEELLSCDADRSIVTTESDFSTALGMLASSRYDLVILDVRRQGDEGLSPEMEAGAQLLEGIRAARFLPIIFYTGLPHLVESLGNPPIVQIVTKGGTHEGLLGAIRTTIQSRLPSMNRAIVEHIDQVQRDYMWNFVAATWNKITAETDQTMVAHLLARRLAGSLSGPSVANLAQGLGDDGASSDDHIHPMAYYVMPPIDEPPTVAGDIYKGEVNDRSGYWIMVTPSCDLVQGKADWLLLATCDLLSDQPEYKKWAARRSGTSRSNLKKLLDNNRKGAQQDRHFYLPPAMNVVPGLVVDLQNVVAVPRDKFASVHLERLATLDSPFAETLTTKFSRLFGRIGTPDLDTGELIERLARP